MALSTTERERERETDRQRERETERERERTYICVYNTREARRLGLITRQASL